MTKVELQSKMRNDLIQLSRLAWAVSKLPESETRGEMIYKHDRILDRLGNLQYELDKIDPKSCYYGFTDSCYGGPCAICPCIPNQQ